jgi:twinkle protein
VVIVSFGEIRERLHHLHQAGGLPRGSLTGWPSVDKLYTVATGQWTCVTGVPNSGKSEFVDALMVNLAKREPWRFFIYSPENWPLELHYAKILEKYIGKPFDPGPTERMDEEELDAGLEWMRGKFYFGKPTRPDMVSILDEASDHIRTYTDNPPWKAGVVVDPWNQLEHHRPIGQTMTEYVSDTLTQVIDRVREYNLHLWLVAHPAKMQRSKDGTYPIPTPRDIAESAHFWNKADCCLTVHRDQVEGSQDVEIHIQKVRFKHIGRIGLATLKYDRVTGRYHEPFGPTPTKLSDYRKRGEA